MKKEEIILELEYIKQDMLDAYTCIKYYRNGLTHKILSKKQADDLIKSTRIRIDNLIKKI